MYMIRGTCLVFRENVAEIAHNLPWLATVITPHKEIKHRDLNFKK